MNANIPSEVQNSIRTLNSMNMSELAAEFALTISTMFEKLVPSDIIPFSDIDTQNLPDNCLLIIYSQGQTPVSSRILTDTMSPENRKMIFHDLDGMISDGRLFGIRILGLLDAGMVIQFDRIISMIFSGILVLNPPQVLMNQILKGPTGNRASIPKNTVAADGPIRRGRGRPRKNEMSVPDNTPSSTSSKRRRGRPRKNSSEEVLPNNDVPGVTTRHRGRPKKDLSITTNTVLGKKKGRPQIHMFDEAGPSATPKKRGRKPKNTAA